MYPWMFLWCGKEGDEMMGEVRSVVFFVKCNGVLDPLFSLEGRG